MKKINIPGFEIGGNKTFIIAEIGSNHAQDIQLAYKTIDAAIDCGADAVKFQSLNAAELYYNPTDKIVKLHEQIDLREEWHQLLDAYCKRKGIIFFSSPTYLKAVDILESINTPIYKLASAQIGTFPQIIQKVAATGKPVILSTGLVSYGELEKVVNIFRSVNNHNFIILHCNSIYPTPFDKVGLNLMNTYKEMFNCITGFSDHTDGIAIATAAVALGAKVIEKHFILDKSIETPDASISIDKKEFAAMVESIRATELAIQRKTRNEIDDEENTFKKAILYKAIVKTNVIKGQIIEENVFDFKRTTGGIDCRVIDSLIGKKFTENLSAGTLLEIDQFE